MQLYLSTTEVAQRLGLDFSTVRKLILTGRLPAQKVGSRWIISLDDFNTFSASYVRWAHHNQPRKVKTVTVVDAWSGGQQS